MKKKIAFIGLLALMAIAFGACGGESGQNSSSIDVESSTSSESSVETPDSSLEETPDSSSAAVTEHDYKLVEETKGTCSTKGTIAHYSCTECDKLFDLMKNEITSVEGDYDYANHASEAVLAIKEQATKLSYNVGDVFDPTGMVIVQKCDACEGEIIDNQFLEYTYQTAGENAFASGDTKMTVSCNGMSLDVEISVGKAQAQIFGSQESYETVCGVAPTIEVTSNSPESDVIIAYYDGETQVQAADLIADKTYVVKISIASTETFVGTEVSATLSVSHNKVWAATEENPDELVYKCVCGVGEEYSVLTNQVLYVDDADMSIDLSNAVKGVEEYSIQSIEQILLLNNKQRATIEGESEGMVYTFAKEKYEKTASETLEDGSVVYYTPYELALAVKYDLGGNVVESVYVVKYVDKVIRNAEDLLALAYHGAAKKDEGGTAILGHYVLVNDIDASGLTLGAATHAWEALLGFRGVLEGNGHTISNLSVPAWQNGLFGAIGINSKIQNVNFTNVTVGEGGHLFALIIRNSQMTNVNVEFSSASRSFSIADSANDTEFENVSIATKKGVNPFRIDENASNPMPDSITFTYIEVETPVEPENPDTPDDPTPEVPTIPDDTDREKVEVNLSVGQMTDTGTTNEYGKVYNLKQGQWFIDHNNADTMVDFQPNVLANALPEGGEWFIFYLYNPTATEYQFCLEGSTAAGWVGSKYLINLAPQAWTKVVISANEIELNKQGAWYIYIKGGNNDGATQEGWQVSPVYAVMEEGWTLSEPTTNVLLDATKDTLTKWEYGEAIAVEKAIDEDFGNVWNVTVDEWEVVPGKNAEQSIQHRVIDTTYYERVYFYIYNPHDTEMRLTIHGGYNEGWGLKQLMLTPKNWTTVEVDMSVFKVADAGKIYLMLQDPANVSVAGEWKITSFYGLKAGESAPDVEVPETPEVPAGSKVEASLILGQMTDTGTTNEYGKVYDLKQEQWFIDNPNGVTMCSFGEKLVSALPNGYDCFEFYLYNPTDTEYKFHLAGNVDGTWTDSYNDVTLAAKTWTKIVIFSADIQNTGKGDWYMYIQGGNSDGAAQVGWQISTIYAVKA